MCLWILDDEIATIKIIFFYFDKRKKNPSSLKLKEVDGWIIKSWGGIESYSNFYPWFIDLGGFGSYITAGITLGIIKKKRLAS